MRVKTLTWSATLNASPPTPRVTCVIVFPRYSLLSLSSPSAGFIVLLSVIAQSHPCSVKYSEYHTRLIETFNKYLTWWIIPYFKWLIHGLTIFLWHSLLACTVPLHHIPLLLLKHMWVGCVSRSSHAHSVKTSNCCQNVFPCTGPMCCMTGGAGLRQVNSLFCQELSYI